MKNINNQFKSLLEEIDELNKYENKTIPEKFIKFNEEFGEFSAEVVKLLGLTYKEFNKEHLVEEMADSLQVMLSIFLSIGEETNISINDVLSEMVLKNKKWRVKIPDYKNKQNL